MAGTYGWSAAVSSCGAFADEGLLDEIIVGVAPVTLGAGAPLLPRLLGASRLRLKEVERADQFVYLTYELRGVGGDGGS